MLTLQEVKEHLRVDFEDDDRLLAGYIKAADNYMTTAIDGYHEKLVASDASGDTWGAAAKLAQMIMIADWYETRTSVETAKCTSVNVIVQQLQLIPPRGYVE